MEFTKSLSEVLELEIKLRHKNIKQFSEKSGIAYMTISSVLKRGVENTTVSTLKKICDALGITINHLFDKQKIYTINDLGSCLKKLLKEKQIKPKNKNIMLSVVSQAQKTIYHRIPFV